MINSSMSRSPLEEKLLLLLVGKILTSFSNATEVAQWATPSCSRPQRASDNGVRDGRSNLLVVTPTTCKSVPPNS